MSVQATVFFKKGTTAKTASVNIFTAFVSCYLSKCEANAKGLNEEEQPEYGKNRAQGELHPRNRVEDCGQGQEDRRKLEIRRNLKWWGREAKNALHETMQVQ